MMIDLALNIPSTGKAQGRSRQSKTTSDAYYGSGYQDVQNRVPKIDNTRKDLAWEPKVDMETALKNIFDAYRTHVADARDLMD
jgi:nucleoside-diphosphate-sugar epimerase